MEAKNNLAAAVVDIAGEGAAVAADRASGGRPREATVDAREAPPRTTGRGVEHLLAGRLQSGLDLQGGLEGWPGGEGTAAGSATKNGSAAHDAPLWPPVEPPALQADALQDGAEKERSRTSHVGAANPDKD